MSVFLISRASSAPPQLTRVAAPVVAFATAGASKGWVVSSVRVRERGGGERRVSVSVFRFFASFLCWSNLTRAPPPVPPQQVEEGLGRGRRRYRAADDATTELVADEGLAATPSTSLAAPDPTINPRMSRLTPLFPKTPSPVGRPPMPPRRRGNVARFKGWDAVEWRVGKWGGLGWDA